MSPADIRCDYERFLAEYGFDEGAVRRVVENKADLVPMPPGFEKVRVGPSSIAGIGLHAVAPIAGREEIAPARWQDRRTPAGRYVNHSPVPNARYAPARGDIVLIALRDIAVGEEVLADYRQAGTVNGWGMRPEPMQLAITVRERLAGMPVVCHMGDEALQACSSVMLARFGHLPSPESVRAFVLQWCSANANVE